MEIINDLLYVYKIAEVSDYFWPPGGARYEIQWMKHNKPFDVGMKIKENSIIFADAFFIDKFYDVFGSIDVPFYLISAESDFIIPYQSKNNPIDSSLKLLENKCLIKWFSINIGLNHPKLISIPLGIPKHIPFIINDKDNFMGWKYHFDLDEINSQIQILLSNLNLSLNNFFNENKKLLYSRMTVTSSQHCLHSYENIRNIVVESLKNNIFIDSSLVPWHQYMYELKDYKFCLSLPGKGLDCYRTWESLTLGVIPIVLKTDFSGDLYNDLPVLQLQEEELKNINESFLENEFLKIKERQNTFNFKKLTTDWWKKYIFNNIKT